MTAADEQRLRDYRERGTLDAVMRRTSWQFKLWTFVGFLGIVGVAAILLWWADVPDSILRWRAVSIALSALYWPAIGAWAVRRSRPRVDRA